MPLKEFVSAYIKRNRGKDVGKKERVAFNKKPADELSKYSVAGDDLKALLSFNEPTISEQVLKDVLAMGWTETNAKQFSKWLQAFAYRTDINWTTFVVAGLMVMAITLATVSIQAVKTALLNPVKNFPPRSRMPLACTSGL